MVGLAGGMGWLDGWVYPWGDGLDWIGLNWDGTVRDESAFACVLIFDISVVITLNSMFVLFEGIGRATSDLLPMFELRDC